MTDLNIKGYTKCLLKVSSKIFFKTQVGIMMMS